MEAVEPVREIVEQRPFGLDPVGEGLDDAFRIEDRVGFRALREQHADQRPGTLALGRRGEGRGGDLVGAVAELRAAPQELVDDAGQRLVAATDGRPIGDVRAGAVAAGDVAGIRETAIDRADGVRVDAQGSAQLADRWQTGPGLEAAGVDLERRAASRSGC